MGLEDTQIRDRRMLKAGGLWQGGLPAPALPEGCDPLGVAPEPSRVLTSVLQAFSPAETPKHPFPLYKGLRSLTLG